MADIELTTGEVRPGVWCDVCQLPAALEMDVLADGKSVGVSTVGCPDCGTGVFSANDEARTEVALAVVAKLQQGDGLRPTVDAIRAAMAYADAHWPTDHVVFGAIHPVTGRIGVRPATLAEVEAGAAADEGSLVRRTDEASQTEGD